MDWSPPKLATRLINNHTYEVYKYWIPKLVRSKLKWLNRWFRIADRENIERENKRRKADVEGVETAVIVFNRITQLMDIDVPVAVGSAWLGERPWAVFGDCPVDAELKIKNVRDLLRHYEKLMSATNPELIHFRCHHGLVHYLSRKYKMLYSHVVAASICLLYDILINAGPDCDEVYDVFSNDLTEKQECFDIEKWQDQRCRIMGRYGKILERSTGLKVGQVYEPKFELKSSVTFELISDKLDEKVIKIPVSRRSDDDDDDDEAYRIAMEAKAREVMRRHPNLRCPVN